ncbi:MAG: DUF1952 domain-containing protein [Anaerolineales bacterium]
MKIEREVHGVPLWLMHDYLVESGGDALSVSEVAGEGWKAHFVRIEDFRIGSLAIGRARLTIEGEDAAVEQLMAQMEMKLIRGGG